MLDFIRRRRFRLVDPHEVRVLFDWLSQFDRGCEQVRRLLLQDFDPASPDPAYFDLLSRCTKLEALTLTGLPYSGNLSPAFVYLPSAEQYAKNSQSEIVPRRLEDLELYRGLRDLRRLEWHYNDHGRRTNDAAQLKLLVGSNVEVYIIESGGYYKWTKELITEELAVREIPHLKELPMA